MSKKRFRRGFTFIEVIVVVLMIGILAAVALPRYTRGVENARADIARAIVSQIGMANRSYRLDRGCFITTGALANSTACSAQVTPCGPGPISDLTGCRYLPAQDWTNNTQYYAFTASDNCGCGALAAGANWVACATRLPGGCSHCTNTPPYSAWVYSMDDQGNLNACPAGASGPPSGP